ncbi:MAG: four helix bundle protein [Bacteroidota bacterium]|nr:four helix bundle protein [Bacteroidota bacterium]
MAKIEKFEDLEVWQVARELCKIVYSLTKKDLFCKDFELVRQIQKSSGSIMDNIAEGYERDGNKEFMQFLSISKGSCGEVRSQSYRALDQSYISKEEFEELYNKASSISKMLSGFINYLRKSEINGIKYKNR